MELLHQAEHFKLNRDGSMYVEEQDLYSMTIYNSHVTFIFECLGLDSLQVSMFYKILMGHFGISFSPEVHEITRASGDNHILVKCI